MSNITPHDICSSFFSLQVEQFQHISINPIITVDMYDILSCSMINSGLPCYSSPSILLHPQDLGHVTTSRKVI